MLLGFYIRIATYQITMNDTRRVNVLETTHDLIEEVLHELFFKRPAGEQAVQVGPQKFGDEIQIL